MQRLKVLHLQEWMTAWNDAFDELSRAHSIFCVCGKVASGLHERSCSAFRKKVDDAAIKRLEYLIESKSKIKNQKNGCNKKNTSRY